MPLYEFRCRSCQLQFTKLARLSEAGSPLGCPACGAPVTKLVSSCALHRSEAARLADFDPRDARRPDFYRDAHNVGLAAKRRLRDSAVDLGPRAETSSSAVAPDRSSTKPFETGKDSRMVHFTLTDEQLTLQRTVRNFAAKEIPPIVEQVERMDHRQATPWQLVRPVFQKASGLGLTHLLIPEEYGGGGAGCLDNALVQEEFGALDVGIASAYFNLAATSPMVIVAGATDAQRRDWLGEICASDDFIVASASSEADQAGSDTFCPYADPRVGLRTTSVPDGDDYVLNGTKAAFITSAGVASAYFVMARNDLHKPGFMSTSFFYVPADTPGLSVGPRTELIGWKTAHNAEVVLEDVRVPKNRLLGEQEFLAPNVFGAAYPYIAVGFAACHVGLARAATEYATKYARERTSWLQPIIKHQAVARLLADAMVETELARLAVWDAACAADARSESVLTKVPIAKTYATDTAIKAAEAAVKVLGSNGITREYQTARYLNDAWIGWACDGANDVLRLNMIAMQEMQREAGSVGGPFQTAG